MRLIDADALLEKIDTEREILVKDGRLGTEHILVHYVREFIEDAPTIDRPQGEWVDAEIPLESGDTMPIQVCNLCKTFYPLAYTGGGHRFCPNCGARMKGADDE